jgi:hypothetical protein
LPEYDSRPESQVPHGGENLLEHVGRLVRGVHGCASVRWPCSPGNPAPDATRSVWLSCQAGQFSPLLRRRDRAAASYVSVNAQFAREIELLADARLLEDFAAMSQLILASTGLWSLPLARSTQELSGSTPLLVGRHGRDQGDGEEPGHQAVVTWPPWMVTVTTGVTTSSQIV